MKAYTLSETGRVRSINQDTYYQPHAGENFAVIADGMGGHRAGEVASSMAIEEFVRWLKCAPSPNIDTLKYAVSEANRAIYNRSRIEADKAGMGTTLTALWMDDDNVYLTHIGDSRAYRLRNNELKQISRDHTVVNELIENGVITREEAKTHPQRHYITRALGTSPQVEADITVHKHEPGDVWLICSDGLSNYLSLKELRDFLVGRRKWPVKVEQMMQCALDRGGVDNITVMVIVCDGGAQ